MIFICFEVSPISPLAQTPISEKDQHSKRESGFPRKYRSEDDMTMVSAQEFI